MDSGERDIENERGEKEYEEIEIMR